MRGRRGGIALAELLAAVLLLVIVVRVALPAYQRITLRTEAASVVDRIDAVRDAAVRYRADQGHWPPDMDAGLVPPGLVPYLGEDFSFTGKDHLLEWGHWPLLGDAPGDDEPGLLVGVSLITDNAGLRDAVASGADPDAVQFTLAERHTFIIAAQ